MRFYWIAISAALLLLIFAGYSFWIEPEWLEVTHHEICAPVSSPLKIAHLTDLHLREIGRLERKLLDVLESEKPDLIAITGDNVTNEESSHAVANEFLALLHAPLGVYSVNGNWEHWTAEEKPERAVASLGNITSLDNSNRQVRPDLWVVGLDDAFAGKPKPELAAAGLPKNTFCVLLFHSPSYFPDVADICPLSLAGHTHGGQVRLPFYGPLWLPSGSGNYVSGWYEKENAKMYVSRGIGTSILDVRFLARPEVAFITVRSKQ